MSDKILHSTSRRLPMLELSTLGLFWIGFDQVHMFSQLRNYIFIAYEDAYSARI